MPKVTWIEQQEIIVPIEQSDKLYCPGCNLRFHQPGSRRKHMLNCKLTKCLNCNMHMTVMTFNHHLTGCDNLINAIEVNEPPAIPSLPPSPTGSDSSTTMPLDLSTETSKDVSNWTGVSDEAHELSEHAISLVDTMNYVEKKALFQHLAPSIKDADMLESGYMKQKSMAVAVHRDTLNEEVLNLTYAMALPVNMDPTSSHAARVFDHIKAKKGQRFNMQTIMAKQREILSNTPSKSAASAHKGQILVSIDTMRRIFDFLDSNSTPITGTNSIAKIHISKITDIKQLQIYEEMGLIVAYTPTRRLENYEKHKECAI